MNKVYKLNRKTGATFMNNLVPISIKRAIARMISREAPKYFTREEAKRIISPGIKAGSYGAWFLCLFLYSTGM